MSSLDVYLEVGSKRTFAVAVDWPGWARSGRDEDAAIAALLAYADRYGTAMGGVVPFHAPTGAKIVERIAGNATTDFGAPGVVPDGDEEPLAGLSLTGSLTILRACWAAFDRAATASAGATLSTGPRGGGRSLDKIIAHVFDAERSYVTTVGGAADRTTPIHDLFEAAVIARADGQLLDTGPRGGKRWPARYAIRRAAWHALDHAWEIEDRVG